jgi:S-adenosylmethionine:tRNA-ribosyltransferase-isomerase (queuine synthetase)
MRATLVSVLLACLMSNVVPPHVGAQQFEADLVIVNANVRTLDASRPVVEAIAVHGGRIVAVGTSESRRS